jgi:acetone carboxylase gamma subunit
VKNAEIFQSGLIVMGDLPRWKMKRVFKVVKNTQMFQSDLVVMDDQPRWKILEVVRKISQKWFHCNGQPAQKEFLKRSDCDG